MTAPGYSPDAYRMVIGALKAEGYIFRSFPPVSEGGPIVYLRHDIDYSPPLAADMARLNGELGISALFCIQVRSPLYNLAAPYVTRCVRQILDYGQKIGLHVSLTEEDAFEPTTITATLRRDFELGRRIIPEIEPYFSLHNPSTYVGSGGALADLNVPGFINLYSGRLTKEMSYFSDSNMRHSLTEWMDIARSGRERLHILFHPALWMLAAPDAIGALGRLFAQMMRDKESEFSTNHVFRRYHPHGLREEDYVAIRRIVAPEQ